MKKISLKNHLLIPILLCLFVAIVHIAAQFLIAHLMVWLLGASTLSKPIWTALYQVIVYTITTLIIFFAPKLLFKKSSKLSRERLGLTGLPTFKDIGLAPAAFLIFLIISVLASNILSNFAWFDANAAQNTGFTYLYGSFDRAVAFIALVIVAPILEELVFRGWLYDKLREKLPLIPAILFVSILFGALHGQLNVAINVGLMSVILCLERELTGTIYSGILTHMIKNAVAFFLLFVVAA